MSQVFTPSATLLIKLGLIGLLLFGAAAIAIVTWSMQYPHAVGAPVEQPIPFSHKHHVGDDGIDCRYCHTTVESGRSAGLPSTEICMTCHSQLFKDAPMLAPLRESLSSGRPLHWNRVHQLPGFVYFDHSIHVHKGVACLECHGRVDQMPLTERIASLEMRWCLACHRAPAGHLHPPEQVFAMGAFAPLDKDEQLTLQSMYRLPDTRRLTDCSSCHR
jgi:hypothetical protein